MVIALKEPSVYIKACLIECYEGRSASAIKRWKGSLHWFLGTDVAFANPPSMTEMDMGTMGAWAEIMAEEQVEYFITH